MKRVTMKRLLALLVCVCMCMSMVPASAFAASSDGGNPPQLKEGVTDVTDSVLTGTAYYLTDLQNGDIFTDPDGDKLTAEDSYFYQRSTDGGATWGSTQNFSGALFGGTIISLVETQAGTYTYRFWAVDTDGNSSASAGMYWTLTLNVCDTLAQDYSFYVGQDHNYDTNGGKYPILKMWKSAGVQTDENSTWYNHEYVGTYVKDGATQYVYEPADYIISGNAEEGWTIKESADGASYALSDYEPVTFGTSSTGVASGTVKNTYNMFYAKLYNGTYCMRSYGYSTETGDYTVKLGGMQVKLPAETNVDGNVGGGTQIYLREVSFTMSNSVNSTSLAAKDFDVDANILSQGSSITQGDPYVDSTGIAHRTCMFFAGGNLYTFTLNFTPTDSLLSPVHLYYKTVDPGTAPLSWSATTSAMSRIYVKVPVQSEFNIYYQNNNFNTVVYAPEGSWTDNGDGTKTISYLMDSKFKAGSIGNYTWRLADTTGKYVTKAGWLYGMDSGQTMTLTFDSTSETDRKSHDTSKMGTVGRSRDEADLQVYLDSSSYECIGKEASRRIRAYRMWELINSDSANIMIEPDFHWQVLCGKATVSPVSGGNTSGNWADVDPDGTAIIAVEYDALDAYLGDSYSSHGGFYPATSPNRTGVVVISDSENGTADAVFQLCGNEVDSFRSDEWDYNYDTWNYLSTDKNPTMDFTVEGDDVSKVEYAFVTTDTQGASTLSDWADATKTSDGYSIGLNALSAAGSKGGNVIIKMTDSTGVSYRVVRAAEVSITITNDSAPGEDLMPGDSATITFDGLYRGVNKMSGIFNPTSFHLVYTSSRGTVEGTNLGQYCALDGQSVSVTIPKDISFEEGSDTTTFTLQDGYMYGSMYSAASSFDTVYSAGDYGVGTNFNAILASFGAQHMFDIDIPVSKRVTYNAKLAAKDGDTVLQGATFQLTDSSGNEVDVAADGACTLTYGTYRYVAKADGYATKRGSFTVGSADASKVGADGILGISLDMEQYGANPWDGYNVSEPATDAKGVYQIGTGAELAWFAKYVNAGNASASAVLTADIELAGQKWTSIGTASKPFAGSFDGQGHAVRNLCADYSAYVTTTPYRGLFGVVKGTESASACVSNLGVDGTMALDGSATLNNAYSGSVVGSAEYATLSDLSSSVAISVNTDAGYWYYIGGIVGCADNCTIQRCANYGDVEGKSLCGGIAGGVEGGTVVDQCLNCGNVTASRLIVGGVVGNIPSSTSVSVVACVNKGEVSSTNNSATSVKNVGGIVGNATSGTLVSCIDLGKVSAASPSNTGALVGNPGSGFQAQELYYLSGTADEGFGNTEKVSVMPVSLSASQFASSELLASLNSAAQKSAFVPDGSTLGLSWQETWCATCGKKTSSKVGESTAANCSARGVLGSVTCAVCGQVKQEGSAFGDYGPHAYGSVTFTFSADGESAQAHWTCKYNSSHTGTVNARITSEVTLDPTCGTAGQTTYTAYVIDNRKKFSDTLVLNDVAATGEHSYGNDGVCTVCGNYDASHDSTTSGDDPASDDAQKIAQTQSLLDSWQGKATSSATWNTVTLKWNACSAATFYVVTRSGKQVYKGNACGFVDKTVALEKTYTYTVSPVAVFNSKTTLVGKGCSVSAKPSLAKAKAPTVSSKKKGRVKVAWKAVAGATGYQIWYKVGKKTKTLKIAGAKKLSKALTKLGSKKKVTVKVRAYRAGCYGPWSAAKKIKTK